MLASGCGRHTVEIVKNQKTDYRIVIIAGAPAYTLKAANELQSYLEKISGVQVPVVEDTSAVTGREILLGHSSHLSGLMNNRYDSLKDDGFRVFTKGNTLVFEPGAGEKALLYAVYDFLENKLGCRMYAPDAIVIPHRENIRLKRFDYTCNPFFTMRETLHRFPNISQQYADWHKLQNRADADSNWGMFVHTLGRLVPADKYYRKHPEYFAEINGKRVADGQLCLSNPEVFHIVVDTLRKLMAAKPNAIYWSVSQNDNYNFCTCDKCRAIDSEYHAQSGSVLSFVNKVAAQFPGKIISTLAYQYSRQAPEGIKPLPNVNIMLCSIECNRSIPLADDPGEAGFRKDMEDWGRLTHNILVWDYVVQFRNYMDPFPNLHVLQPNVQYFKKNGCTMMFEQGSSLNVTEFHELRTYLLAKLLWNPDVNIRAVRTDFLNGYYGPASPYIASYIDLMQDELVKSKTRLDIYGYPFSAIHSYLKPELLPRYEHYFAQARQAVANDSVYLKRVVRASLPLEFAILDISLHHVNDTLSWFRKSPDGLVPREDLLKRLDTFVRLCGENHIEKLEESGFSPEEFRERVREFIQKGSCRNLAYGKPVTLLTEYSRQYDAGGAAALTNGLLGLMDYHYNWLGFHGDDMVAVIDLQKNTTLKNIRCDFLQEPLSWIFLPTEVEFWGATKENSFTLIGKSVNTTPQDKGKTIIQTFSCPVNNKKYRWIKVVAKSLKTCPVWHRGYGNPCWIFCDEVIAE